jgi:hypothetical protein
LLFNLDSHIVFINEILIVKNGKVNSPSIRVRIDRNDPGLNPNVGHL